MATLPELHIHRIQLAYLMTDLIDSVKQAKSWIDQGLKSETDREIPQDLADRIANWDGDEIEVTHIAQRLRTY